MSVLQGHNLSFLALKTCTKHIHALSSRYGKFNTGLLCSAPDSSCVAWRELLYYLRSIICRYSYRSKHQFQCTYLRCFNFTPITSHHIHSHCHPITHQHIPRQIWGIYRTVYRHFLLRIHTNTHPVLPAVLLQLFTPRSHIQLCGRKDLASAMGTQSVWQSIVHQYFHYNHHQQCFLIYDILHHVKILSCWILGFLANFRKASISLSRLCVRPITRSHQWAYFHEIVCSETFENFSRIWKIL